MRKSMLYFLTALTLLAGCKKEEEEAIKEDVTPSFEEQVKSIYSYPITVKVDTVDCLLWVNYRVSGENYCFTIETPTDFEGLASDFILRNQHFNIKMLQEAKEGWFNIARVKTEYTGEVIYRDVIDIMNEENNYFYYIYKVFND